MNRSRRRTNTFAFLSLDSLVDIVTNNVGILIILSAFMALFSLAAPTRKAPVEQRVRVTPPPPTIQVPWSHPTSKQTLFFVLRGKRVLYVDLKQVYEQMLASTSAARGGPVQFAAPGVGVRFFPITNQVYCFEFAPKPGAGETLAETRLAGSQWARVLARFPRENFVYFFWVSGDSFEGFRDLRKSLLDRQVEVGWKPVKSDVPLEVCNGFEGSNTFQPQ